MENKKVGSNPAKLLKCKHEDSGRIRFLNQNGAFGGEKQLRATIETKYLNHLPEFEIALSTGMRPSEQYSLSWDRVWTYSVGVSLFPGARVAWHATSP